MRYENPPSTGSLNGAHQTRPVRMIGQDKTAIERTPPAGSTDLHPSRNEAR